MFMVFFFVFELVYLSIFFMSRLHFWGAIFVGFGK